MWTDRGLKDLNRQRNGLRMHRGWWQGERACSPHEMGQVGGAHHDQSFGDVFRAPMARLAIAGPVVLLAEELSILLIVLV